MPSYDSYDLIQWKLIITISLGPRKFALYVRYFVISVANKQYKTKEINSLGPKKWACYIRYFVISDLFISRFHCSNTHVEVPANLLKSPSSNSFWLRQNTCHIWDPITFPFMIGKQKYLLPLYESRQPDSANKMNHAQMLWYIAPLFKKYVLGLPSQDNVTIMW